MRSVALLVVLSAGCRWVATDGSSASDPRFQWSTCQPLSCRSDLARGITAGGAHSAIEVYSVKFAAVASSNESVARFADGGIYSFASTPLISVETGVAGDADLIFLDASGRELARAGVHVRPVVKLGYDHHWPGSEVELAAGAPETFHVDTLDGAGQSLVGVGAVRFSATGSLTIDTDRVAIGDETVFHGAAGDQGAASLGSIVAQAGQASAELSVRVVGTIQSIALAPHSTEVGGTLGVAMTALGDAGPVYGVSCQWTTDDPAAYVRDQLVGSITVGAPVELTTFAFTRPGVYHATCSALGRASTIELRR